MILMKKMTMILSGRVRCLMRLTIVLNDQESGFWPNVTFLNKQGRVTVECGERRNAAAGRTYARESLSLTVAVLAYALPVLLGQDQVRCETCWPEAPGATEPQTGKRRVPAVSEPHCFGRLRNSCPRQDLISDNSFDQIRRTHQSEHALTGMQLRWLRMWPPFSYRTR